MSTQRCQVHKHAACKPGDEYEPCGEPAHWYTDDDGLHLCESHVRDVLLYEGREVTGTLDGDVVVLDADGEIVRAA